MNKKQQEQRFIKWAESRDDDWWEDQARLSIWDFRVMQDFFAEEFDQLSQDLIEEIREELKKYATAENEDTYFIKIKKTKLSEIGKD